MVFVLVFLMIVVLMMTGCDGGDEGTKGRMMVVVMVVWLDPKGYDGGGGSSMTAVKMFNCGGSVTGYDGGGDEKEKRVDIDHVNGALHNDTKFESLLEENKVSISLSDSAD
nr:hypothetical protein [Tanacetum cinerariifolium]